MSERLAEIFLVLSVLATAILGGCGGSDHNPTQKKFTVVVAADASIPNPDDLKAKIELFLRQPIQGTTYIEKEDHWVETKEPIYPLSGVYAIVQSYDPNNRVARINLIEPEYPMPVVQYWYFDGKNWFDIVDPGFIVK